ncbi:hypothetical protein Vspart_00828 [Vibrio spartinae]|uniref:Uncharacterized protein n=1 Tax=Vibrio spartinae TaxID=1918945 RepID=A0ABX6QXD1_9VIBR|nr:hypothetical protein Vspart_00828 [Vibrio spartinae]
MSSIETKPRIMLSRKSPEVLEKIAEVELAKKKQKLLRSESGMT